MTLQATTLEVVDATITRLHDLLESGAVTSVDLVNEYIRRIGGYDRHGILLNAVPVLNPDVFVEARQADLRRARGRTRSRLDGIPYTAKDSYMAKGLTVAAGSPAFRDLVAQHDSFAVARLRDSGAILIGLTNMPPMAAGGMQRGLYGRAESPYNPDYLPSAYASGSSNGSGVATAASFAAFGLGEETWSSGRAPASNNALVAYTPSRGVISVRGNWPLVPTMDVVVPHTRTVRDLLEVLDVLIADDDDARGDLWRRQTCVRLPQASKVRPACYRGLYDPLSLRGRRLGVPRQYIGRDTTEGPRRVYTSPDVIALWTRARQDLVALGAEVVEVGFPVVSNYEGDGPAGTPVARGIIPPGYADEELGMLWAWSWDDFLRLNGDPSLHRLVDVDGDLIYPAVAGALPDHYDRYVPGMPALDLSEHVTRAKAGLVPPHGLRFLAAGLRGLETTRRLDFEIWLRRNRLDAVVFPTAGDVGRADADQNPESFDHAWLNGVGVSNGNLAIRHYGIPTVTVPMGQMRSNGMPVGLTFAGYAYSDNSLLAYAAAYEAATDRRRPPPRTPPLAAPVEPGPRPSARGRGPQLELSASVARHDDSLAIRVTAVSDADRVAVYVNGESVSLTHSSSRWQGSATVPADEHTRKHSQWRGAYGSIVSAVASSPSQGCVGSFITVGGSE